MFSKLISILKTILALMTTHHGLYTTVIFVHFLQNNRVLERLYGSAGTSFLVWSIVLGVQTHSRCDVITTQGA